MSKLFPDKGFPFQSWREQDKQTTLIYIQWGVIALSVLMIIFLWIGWYRAPSHMVVYLPPDTSQAALTKPNTIPKPYVYAFGFQIWQEINYWPSNGVKDYQENIKKFSSYLTPRFNQLLIEDYKAKQLTGELNRTRSIQGIDGSGFDIKDIKKLSANVWEIDVDARLTETSDGVVTKDIEIEYPLKVVRMQISLSHNPFGLALDGFVSTPKRIKTLI
ncbi:MAG: TIGR03746 family integrating conjugative element protein [Legionellales bacterium]|nr:TIGR03746 family integrating conjugative element protein [Legionellales bacterium]